jgi:DNA-binding NarL/FixJ family response regulator
MRLNNEKLLLVTNPNPQSRIFTEYVGEKLGLKVMIVAPSKVSDIYDVAPQMVLLDTDHLDEVGLQQWQDRVDESQSMILAAFNCRGEEHAADMLDSLRLRGVFYRHDSPDMICKGIGALSKGELWMSRALMTRLIKFYRHRQLNNYRPAYGLTQRELEIIGLLGSGASNTTIAHRLFISEHTVRSHTQNIFRKIKVRNRIQAMNWARQNLGIAPLRHNQH